MKKSAWALMAGFSMAVLVAGGCASNETVKKEEPVAATVKAEAPKVQPAKPTPPPQPVKPTPPPQPKQEPKAEPPKQVEQQAAKAAVAEVNFETIYFDFDKSDLRPEARDALTKNAEIMLKKKTTGKVTIEGHCDERGSAEYNLALGERRAKSALQYLLTLGVPSDRVTTVSYGKEKPAVDGHDEAAWAKNRRAEFK